ncbi:RyR domain-containing protein [Thiohalocapsa halophila]
MLPWRTAPLVLWDGDAPSLAQARAVLSAQGVRVRRRRGRIPKRAGLLLLAAGPDLPQRLGGLRSALATRRWPLRVVVLREPGAAAGEPDDVTDFATGTELPPGVLRLEWMDPLRTAARVMFGRWPLHRSMDPPAGQVAHLLIAGFGPFAQASLLHALRVGQYADEPPLVTLAAETPERWRDWIAAHHPRASACARLRYTALPTPDCRGTPPVTMIVICDAGADAALSLARALASQAAEQGASPLVALATEDAWPKGRLADWDGQLVPLQPLHIAYSREVLLEGRDDALAEVIHEHYRDTSAAQGRDPAAAPSGRPWPQLATSYKDANRHQADHLWAKLAVTDCRAVPEELVESFAFAPPEVERLAIIEHRRWAVERWLDGWTYGPERDNARKRHPQLIPYSELSDAMQDLDRFAVRLVPALLARSGLGVVRRLIVGVRSDGLPAPQGPSRRATRAVLGRLAARYPDRGMTLAVNLTDPPARLVAAAAAVRHGAAVFVLLPGPLPSLLSAQSTAHRLGMLRLLAIAERRIQLRDQAALKSWLGRRAEILLALGEEAASPSPDTHLPAKQVRLSPAGDARWNFAY